MSVQLLRCDSAASAQGLELWLHIGLLLCDVEITGECVRKLFTYLHNGALEKQFLCVLNAVKDVGGAYVVAPPSRGIVHSQQV